MEPKQKNVGLMYGLFAALSIVLFSVLLYVGGIKLYLGSLAYLGYVIVILIAVLGAVKQKKINGGYLEFGQALKITFTIFLIAFLAQTIFTYILLNFIDTNFKTLLTQASLEKAEAIMRKFGVSEDQLEKAMDAERSKDQFSLGKMALGFVFSCILQFLFALIISAIVKKKNPALDNFTNQA